jgi:hypothetical protein
MLILRLSVEASLSYGLSVSYTPYLSSDKEAIPRVKIHKGKEKGSTGTSHNSVEAFLYWIAT